MSTRVKMGKKTTANFEIALSHSLLGFPMSDVSSEQKSDPFVYQSKFESGRFCCGCVDVRVREECPVNLLKEVKKAPMAILIHE